MGIMSKLTVTPLLYACGGLAVIAAGLGLALWVQSGLHAGALATAEAARQTAQTEADGLSRRVTDLEAANAGNATANRDLANRLAACVGQGQATDTINRNAVAARDAAVMERDIALAKLRNQRNAGYENDPSCKEWGARPVCSAVSGSVRQQWEAVRSAADPRPDR